MRRVIGIGLVTMALTNPAWAQTDPPAAAPGAPSSAPANSAPTSPAPSSPVPATSEMRELLDAAKATARATRENLDYAKVTPDLLYQILAKLDKIEDKLDKVENAIKRETARARR
jgi:hypothetical protein